MSPPTVSQFEQALSPYGTWVDTPEYGRAWVPRVSAGWRPYTRGEWTYTDYGWTFVSHDPWGWAPFHYGRWAYLPSQGWAWVPGSVWSPAWVSWRYSGDYIGWAPLAPGNVPVSYYSTPSLWVAVRAPNFHGPLRRRLFVPTRVIGGVLRTTYFSGIPSSRIYYSPPARYIARARGRSVYRIAVRSVAPFWVRRGVAFRPRWRLRQARLRRSLFYRARRRWRWRRRMRRLRGARWRAARRRWRGRWNPRYPGRRRWRRRWGARRRYGRRPGYRRGFDARRRALRRLRRRRRVREHRRRERRRRKKGKWL